MPYKPGQSGNPAGSAKIKRFIAAIDRAIAQDSGDRLRKAADKLLDLAAAGEAWALKELADRLDGKSAQSVAITGNEGADLFASLVANAEALKAKIR